MFKILIAFVALMVGTGCASAMMKHATTEILFNNGSVKIEMNGNQYLTLFADNGLASTVITPKDLIKDIAKIKKWDKELTKSKDSQSLSKKVKSYFSAKTEIKYHFDSANRRSFTLCFQDGRYTHIISIRCGTVDSNHFDEFERSMKEYPEALAKIEKAIKTKKSLK